jgi:hypothetical protein
MQNMLSEEPIECIRCLPLAIVEGDVSGVAKMKERHGSVVVVVEAA